MDETEIKHFVEAALFAAGRPLSVDEIQGLFDGRSAPDKPLIRKAIKALEEDYAPRGLEIAEVASGFRVQVRAAMVGRLGKLWEERPPRYSRALFETLALVAYRQPITRGEIEEVRGVSVSPNIVRTLLEREWIRVVGHRDVPGRPAMFGTTRQFLDYFGLKKLDDLPPLADLADWESLRVQLNLPAVDEEEETGAVSEPEPEPAEVTPLPVLAPEAESAADEQEPSEKAEPDADELARAEALADTGFEEIIAKEWPDPAGSLVGVLESEPDEASDDEDSRDADASARNG